MSQGVNQTMSQLNYLIKGFLKLAWNWLFEISMELYLMKTQMKCTKLA